MLKGAWGLTLAAVLGCSSSPVNVGGTGTTTGGTTTGGTTTGGTTTGGTAGMANGSPCTDHAQCQSGVCGINGSGNCCAAACSTSDATCGATACDATGACVYPDQGVHCGAPVCSTATLVQNACNAAGACVAGTPAPCANHLSCNSAGTACLTSCVTSADCLSTFYCNAGSCLPQMATGACTSNDACTSGICGISGAGHCCAGPAACATSDITCGASDCDDTGACAYPTGTTACTQTAICTGGAQTGPTGSCNGSGACSPLVVPCAPFICANTTSCFTSCTNASSCEPGAFCDIPATSSGDCCPALDGGTLAVDAVTGSDSACCGLGTNRPCQTLTRAMALINSAQATQVLVTATVDGGGGDWAPDGEAYPVVLGWGVELSAPGVFFLDTDGGNASMFDVQASASDPLGYASIVGSATNPIGVGINAAQTAVTLDNTAISVEARATLYLANALVDNGNDGFANNSAILVQNGATLKLGQDQAAANTGTVYVGNSLGNPAMFGNTGINCVAAAADGIGANVTDAPLVGQSSVVIQGEFIDLYLNDSATVSLTSAPTLGAADCLTGNFTAVIGAVVDGNAALTFKNGLVQCMGFAGLGTSNNTVGNPTLILDNTTVQYCFEGIVSNAGQITVTKSTIQGNLQGAIQMGGILDLGGGGNTVVCNSSKLFASFNLDEPGVGVYNLTSTTLTADNVTWDTPGPDYYSCDSIFASCTCNNASCSVTPGADGMSAVRDLDGGGITTTGNLYLDAGCN